MKTIALGRYLVGGNNPCLIIAEAGVNHNGSLDEAKALVSSAKDIGADCVKFQTFRAEEVVTTYAPKASYQIKTTDPHESQREMLKKLELQPKDYKELISFCESEEIMFLSTPYNINDVDFLDELGVPAFKLSSMHAAEPCFAEYVAKKNKPIILSTGMASLDEVDHVVRAILETGNDQLILLQCTTNYPSTMADANIRAMATLQKKFNTLVGYSDHTENEIACITSVALGACIIEKHFTLDKRKPGPDQMASANPDEFERLVKHIRNAEVVLGDGIKRASAAEQFVALGMRRSIVARRKIEEGELITEDCLTLKRPSNGIKPSQINSVIGRIARRPILADSLIVFSDLT